MQRHAAENQNTDAPQSDPACPDGTPKQREEGDRGSNERGCGGRVSPRAFAVEIPLGLVWQIAVPVDDEGHQLEIEDAQAACDEEAAKIGFRRDIFGGGADSAATASAASRDWIAISRRTSSK